MPVFSSVIAHIQPDHGTLFRRLAAMLVAVLMVAKSATAQLRIEINEGMVAPTPIAIADFTGADGRVSDAGRETWPAMLFQIFSRGF